MAVFKDETFFPSPGTPPFLAEDMNVLSARLKKILTELCGPPMPQTSEFLNPPRGLVQKRDRLKLNWQIIWKNTSIVYREEAYGATATFSTNTITFGEFFLKQEIPDLDLKKVLLHEFLHLVVDMPTALHHGQINTIIKTNLKLPGEPNPLGTD
jgi:hypothetical protein